MSLAKPLGLTPFQIDLTNMAFGSSYPLPYGELGYMLSSMMRQIPERLLRPRFLEACAKGLVSFESWEGMKKDVRERKVICTPLGEQMIRDLGVLMHGHNNDAYHYYKTFDPHIDYSKTPELLDRFSPNKFRVSNKGRRKPTRQQLMDPRWREAQGINAGPKQLKFG